MRIAINQPYMIPYAGYFRLLSSVDLFIVFDDVQFPYPGWCHRNRLTTYARGLEWLTIPLKNMPLNTKIMDITFAEDLKDRWLKQLKKFPVFEKDLPLCMDIREMPDWKDPALFIMSTLRSICQALGIRTEIRASSMEDIRADLKGQDRVIAICEHFKARTYVNASGGIKLYQPALFSHRGIDLKFLTPYQNKTSILERLAYEEPAAVRRDIEQNTRFV